MNLIEAKNAFRASYQSKSVNWAALSRVRAELGTESFNEIVRWLEKGPRSLRRSVLQVSPDSFSEMRFFSLAATSDLRRELLWATAVLGRNVDHLNKFRDSKIEFARQISCGNFSEAEKYLEKVKKEFGHSIWLLESTIAVVQLANGLNAQKEFIRGAISEKIPGLTGYIAYRISERNEESTNIDRFEERYTNVLRSLKKSDWSVRDYAIFKLMNRLPPSKERMADILRRDACISSIDLYETYIRVCEEVLFSEFDQKTKRLVAQCLQTFTGIRDVRVAKALSLLQKDAGRLQRAPNAYNAIEEGILRQNFEEAMTQARQSAMREPENIYALDTAARVAARDSKLSIQEDPWPIELLAKVYSRSDGWHDAYMELRKRAANFKPLEQFCGLRGLVEAQSLNGVADGQNQLLRISLGAPYFGANECALYGADQKELIAGFDLDPSKDQYCALELARQYGNTDCLDIVKSAEQRAIAQAEYSFNLRHFGRVIEYVGESTKFKDSFLRTRAELLCVCSHLELGQLKQAFDLISRVCTQREDLRYQFSLRSLLEGKAWAELKPLAGTLSLPIVLDLYLRDREDDRQRTNLRYAFDEVLLKHNLDRPSRIVESSVGASPKELAYFLRRVAQQDVMDVSLQFRGSRELDEERVNLLSRLAEIDVVHKAEYERELFELTKKLRVQEGLRRLDQSRVFVDIAAYSRWANREVLDQFVRYKALAQVGLSTQGASYSAAVIDFLKHQAPVPPELFEVPSAEGDEILVATVRTLASNFFTDPEFGLEFYLSTRVRHGSFAGHMRGPLDAQNLIGLRDDASGKYRGNEVLTESIPQLTESQKVSVDSAVARFSEGFDSMIAELTQDYLQLHSPMKPFGVFKLSLSPIQYHRLKEIAQAPESSFDLFIGECIRTFWTAVDEPLREVRERLRGGIKARAIKSLEELEISLRAILSWTQLMPVNIRISNARTEIQSAIDRIADWFLPPEESQTEIYTLDQAIDIGIEFTRKASRGFEPNVSRTVNVEGRPVVVGTSVVARVTDCLFIALGNVYQHSGLRNAAGIQLDVTFLRSAGVLKIRVESDVAPGVMEATAEKLDRIRGEMNSPTFTSLVTGEGGRGLIKLKGMFSAKDPAGLQFGFLGDSRFFVEINLSIVPIRIGEAPDGRGGADGDSISS